MGVGWTAGQDLSRSECVDRSRTSSLSGRSRTSSAISASTDQSFLSDVSDTSDVQLSIEINGRRLSDPTHKFRSQPPMRGMEFSFYEVGAKEFRKKVYSDIPETKIADERDKRLRQITEVNRVCIQQMYHRYSIQLGKIQSELDISLFGDYLDHETQKKSEKAFDRVYELNRVFYRQSEHLKRSVAEAIDALAD